LFRLVLRSCRVFCVLRVPSMARLSQMKKLDLLCANFSQFASGSRTFGPDCSIFLWTVLGQISPGSAGSRPIGPTCRQT
ncbi:hypothetical protein KI387_044503, partial [Taxus chinensis]